MKSGGLLRDQELGLLPPNATGVLARASGSYVVKGGVGKEKELTQALHGGRRGNHRGRGDGQRPGGAFFQEALREKESAIVRGEQDEGLAHILVG